MNDNLFRIIMQKINVSRIMIGLVLWINLQCAVSFILTPKRFLSAYELVGIPGETAIMGFGILFLMWNVPYVFATIHPIKNWLSLIEATVMQAIGVFGEAIILFNIPLQHRELYLSVLRFLLFDTAGFVILVSAALILRKQRSEISF
jgi:hypothetical protein